MKKYPEYKHLNLSGIAKEILTEWEKNKIFEKSVSTREGKIPFVFYEGPPSANGLPGIHHVMARSIKDIFCRYQTLKGKQVKRKAGWDTHGLPIELAVEKMLGITKEDIGTKITVDEYNKACRKEVMKYTDKWEELTRVMGYWVDMKDPYITYKNEYIESIWWLLQDLYKKGLIYKGFTIQPYSPAAGTGLSSHELNQPGCYRNVKDRTAIAMFKIDWRKSPKNPNHLWETYLREENSKSGIDTYFLAWTTTPWTLPSNTALAVGKINYCAIKTFNPLSKEKRPIIVILASELCSKYFPYQNQELDFDQYQPGDKNIPWKLISWNYQQFQVSDIPGDHLIGIYYNQLLPFGKPANGDAFKVILGDFVTTTDGTGIVHIAPSFGSDDFRVAKQNNIGSLTFVDKRGKFLENVRDGVFLYGEEYVKEAYLSDSEKQIEFLKQKEILERNGKIKELKSYLSVDDRIVLKLQEEGTLFRKEIYEHSYPHCWRTDKPILYYPLDSWFIKVTAVKDRMVELNKTINWKPEYTGTKRFGNWLETANDWNLSRSRFWGIPLPIWKDPLSNSSEGKYICIGSWKELQEEGYWVSNEFISKAKSLKGKSKAERSQLEEQFRTHLSQDGINVDYLVENIEKFEGAALLDTLISVCGFNGHTAKKYFTPLKNLLLEEFDLHRPYIDRVVIPKEVNLYTRETDLIDVWFDSGSMPYAQLHYPFENKELIDQKKYFPADFIAEGVDQTRGWFYTLHAIATMCFDSIAYKNVVSNGLVLDKKGNKMSKRLGNAVDPFETIEKYGPDATRWYMITNASPWDNLKFDLDGITEVQRKFFGTLYNTYSFFALYANIDGFSYKEKEIPVKDRPEIDRWILSELNSLILTADAAYADYEPTKAGRAIEYFLDAHLSNWYVRLCRRRFWKGDYSTDKIAAYQTLYRCLEVIAQLASPIAPFFMDRLFNDLNSITGRHAVESVHLSNMPESDPAQVDRELEERMEMAQKISSMVLSIRKKENLRVRQPLQRIRIPILNESYRQRIEAVKDLILSEVNVKEIELADESASQIVKNLKLNFKTLGRKCGTHMKAVQAYTQSHAQEIIKGIESSGKYEVKVEGSSYVLENEDVEIIPVDIPGWKVANEGPLTVALDISLSPQLKEEGLARELVNRIQNLRKDKDFDVTDHISVKIKSNNALDPSVNNNLHYICSETLASSLELVAELNPEHAVLVEVDDEIRTLISISKFN